MPIPILVASWGIIKLVTAAGAVKASIWSGTRLIQNGFDLTATTAQLRSDVASGKIFAQDAANLLTSLRTLRRSKTLIELQQSAVSIQRILDSLPPNMRTGLSQSVALEPKIESFLELALKKISMEHLVKKPEGITFLEYLAGTSAEK